MPAPVVVRRCRLEIVRRGGWGWGANREDLKRLAIEALAELALRRVAARCEGTSEILVTSPVRIRVSLNRQEWSSLLAATASPLSDAAGAELAARIDRALADSGIDSELRKGSRVEPTADAVSRKPQVTIDDVPFGSAASDAVVAPERTAAFIESRFVPADSDHPLLDWLVAQLEQGILGAFLRRIPASTLVAWERRIEIDGRRSRDAKDSSRMRAPPLAPEPAWTRAEATGSSASPSSTLETLVRQLASMLPERPTEELVRRLRIYACAAACSREGVSSIPRLQTPLDRYLPIDAASAAERSPTNRPGYLQGGFASADPRASHVARSPSAAPSREIADVAGASISVYSNRLKSTSHRDIRVPSVLPFLSLQPLSRSGYLNMAGMALEAAGLGSLTGAFATALAFKTLDEPARGGRHEPGTLLAAATFAGLAEPASDARVSNLAAHAGEYEPALTALLGTALLAGSGERSTLALTRIDGDEGRSVLLTDANGRFPIALLRSVDDLPDVLSGSDSHWLWIAAELAEPESLVRLDRAGLRFVIDVPPTRGENWCPLRDGQGRRLWTNDRSTAATSILGLAESLEGCEEDVARFWNELGTRRPVAPLIPDRRLDSALTLAAGAALAQIAWDLWSSTEPTHPLLALRRLGDLSGSIRFHADQVSVTVPMGRRAMDLAAHGMFEDVSDVPWLPGRRLTFSQG